MARSDRDAEMIDETQQQFGLVVGRHGRERRVVARPGGIGAGAQVVETQDAKALRIQREARPHHFVPPAAARLIRQPDAARRGNAADRHDHRRTRRTRETPGDGNRFECAAEVQLQLAGNRQHAFAYLDAVAAARRGVIARNAECCRCSSSAPPKPLLNGALESGRALCTAPAPPGNRGGGRLLICRNHFANDSAGSWHLSALCGGCPGVFGPNPSAGLDECANSRGRIHGTQAEKLAFVRWRGSNAPPY